MVAKTTLFSAIIAASFSSFAELAPLDDEDLASVDAQGIGLVLNDISITTVNSTTLTDDGYISINGVDGSDSQLFLDYFSLRGDCGSSNCNLYTTADGEGATIGSFSDPISLDINTESGLVLDNNLSPSSAVNEERTLISLSFPDNSVTDINLDTRFTFSYDSSVTSDDDTGWLQIDGLNLNGSEVLVWAEQDTGIALRAELKLHADDIRYSFASDTSGSLPRGNFTPLSTLDFGEIDAEIYLGTALYQPLRIFKGAGRVVRTPSGPNTGIDSLIVETTPIPDIPTIYNDFYNNQPKSQLTLQNASIGGYNLGNSRVVDLQVHYLRVALHDIQ